MLRLVRVRSLVRANAHDVIVLAGLGLLAYGLGQFHGALAPITVGLGFIAAVALGRR